MIAKSALFNPSLFDDMNLILLKQQGLYKLKMKKKSLFSQRIKQARSKQNQSDSSFPKALCIGLTSNQASDSLKHIQCKNDHEIQKIEIEQQKQQEQVKQGSFVNKLLISEFNQEQIGKIHNQNMQSIAAMSQQQRERYRQMILKQIPSSLLNKLKKSQKEQSNLNNKNLEYSIEDKEKEKKDEIPANQREDEMGDEKQEGQEEQPQRMNGEKQQIKKGLGSLQHLMLNIEKGEIIDNFSEQKVGTPSILSMNEIKQMIENENNQTQIVASRLIYQVCSLLFLPNQQKSNQIGIPLIKISEQYFHLCSLAQDLYTNHIKSLVWQMRRTNFKSCWVEMVTAFTCFVKIVSKWLKLSSSGQNKLINEIKTEISALFERKIHFIGNQRQAASINLLIAQLQIAKQQLQKFNEDSLSIQILIKQNPTQCLDLLLIQESLNSGWLTLLNRLTLQSKRQKHTQFEKASYTIFTLYPLIMELYARDLKTNFLNQQLKVVKEWIYHWLQNEIKVNLMQNQFKKQKYDDQQQEQLIFKYLQSIKIVSIQSYSQILQRQAEKQTISVPNNVLANQLIFLNLEQYFKQSSQHDASEAENIQQMFDYLNNKLSNGPNYINKTSYIILTNLFCVFINHLEYPNPDQSAKQNGKRISYHDINQTNLNTILVSLCRFICQNQQLALLWRVISEQKLKSLIDSYNYSSFGNYCFTRLLLFLTASCPMDGTKSMILEEVIARYPFLFYNAAKEGVYGPEELYTKGNILPEMQSIYQTLTFKDKKQESNMLIRFILRK